MINTEATQTKKSYAVAYMAWLAVALFYLFQYILRSAPSVMVSELRHDFMLKAEDFATMGSYYLYAYSLLQIPLGFLIDYWGVRRTIVLSIILCLGGLFLMSVAQTLWMLQASRVLIGAGSATAFMGAIKIAVDYLPAGQRGLLIGLTLTLGTAGALFAGKPLVLMLDAFGWRTALQTLLVPGALLVILALTFLPKNHHIITTADDSESVWIKLARILRNPKVMLYAILAIGLYTPLSAIADLWGTAYIMQKYNMARGEAAPIVMFMHIGLGIGSFVVTWGCEHYRKIKEGVRICLIALVLLFALFLYGPVVSKVVLVSILLAIGFFCGAEMVCFTGAAEQATHHDSGLTLGVVNTLNMLGGAFVQQAIGSLLDWQWQGAVDPATGLRLYSTDQYNIALTLLFALIALCTLLAFIGLRNGRQETNA